MGSTEDLLQRVESACRNDLSAKALRERLLEVIGRRIPYDGHVFALTDPVTRITTSPHAHIPDLPWEQLPELIRSRYLTETNRPDRMLGGPARSLQRTKADPAEPRMWPRLLRGLDIVDTATVAFGDRYGAWGYLELMRTRSGFDDGDLTALTALAATIATGLRTAVARTFAAPAEDLGVTGPAVVLLGPDLAVRDQTDDAAAALLRLLPPDEPRAPVPAAAYNVGAALIALEHGIPVGEPWSRVHLGGDRWVTVRASRLGTDIAVSIEPSTPTDRMDLLARASGLSRRETEILALLVIGLDSREIAAHLFLSDHTVGDHVKATLAKTGARTRQVLLARVIGGTGQPVES